MDAELAALEEKIKLTAALCRQLRDENRDLRMQLASLAGEKKQLTEKLDSARSRLEMLLKQVPE